MVSYSIPAGNTITNSPIEVQGIKACFLRLDRGFWRSGLESIDSGLFSNPRGKKYILFWVRRQKQRTQEPKKVKKYAAGQPRNCGLGFGACVGSVWSFRIEVKGENLALCESCMIFLVFQVHPKKPYTTP